MSFAEVQSIPLKCPGMYCGRDTLVNGSYSACGACPRGFQPDIYTVCRRCESTPSFYDWFYLGFMCLLCLSLHWFAIDFTNKRKRSLVLLHISALVECSISALLTVLLSDPVGTMNIRSCAIQRLSDWYTLFYNPSPDYIYTLHCTQEITYPLYTISMIYYAFCLLMMMIIRPVISWKFVEGRGSKSIYAALYFLPILIVLQVRQRMHFLSYMVPGTIYMYSYKYGHSI